LHFNRCLHTTKSNPNVPFNRNGHMQGGLGQPHLSRPQSSHKQSQGFLVLEHTRFIYKSSHCQCIKGKYTLVLLQFYYMSLWRLVRGSICTSHSGVRIVSYACHSLVIP
jgi:hypothetical protein